ncbi:lycopene cyclase domain-containing protein [Arthrobacter sp. JSM 101049]|uniref:lycopene cyclase domain-containing protein n=1 Tax=Arthrobacter sp. JSM 101049 TaxID=929097 RepID=UPI003568CA0C
MSAYASLNFAFVGLALLPLLAAALSGRLRRRTLAALGAAASGMLLLTAVFDNIMIGVGLFTYAEATLAGPLVGLAPLGDFAYPLGAAILLPAAWLLLTGDGAKEPSHDPEDR